VSTNGLIQVFEARNVRDVTITAAPDLRSRSALVGSTRIRYFYRSSKNATLILNAAVSAFRSLQSRLGPYPYPTFKVVQSAGGYGMESPVRVFADGNRSDRKAQVGTGDRSERIRTY
ncbi:MAG: hypothetical protein ACTS8Z_09890, partial [Candidatus Limnocylindrales bacterium]